MARRKIIFVIVEGPSDDEALGVILTRLYDKNTVHVEITHGDITSERTVTPENIVSRIGDLVRGYAKSNHYKATDFQEVIHLIDTDGAYIPAEAVTEDPHAEKPFYTITEILTSRPAQIIARNNRKSKNMDRICFLSKVWGKIPYSAYYMSSNLDHVLHNKMNSTDQDKENNALAFAKKYKDHIEEFLAFISDSDFSVSGDFRQSWEYIKEGIHSLERHTNLGICFQEIMRSKP